MKWIFTFLLFPISVQAATLATTRAKVDTWLTNNFPLVISKQNTYFATHDRYWQGLLSCTGTNVIPNFTAASDGDAVQDNMNSKPFYEAESIADIFPTLVGVALPAAFECTQYAGPLGAGYVVTVWVKFNGQIFTRSHNTGPELWREVPWIVFFSPDSR